MRGKVEDFKYWRMPSASPSGVAQAGSALVESAVASGLLTRAAAERGVADAEFAYRIGMDVIGLPDDEARSWIWLAAVNRHQDAAMRLAGILENAAASEPRTGSTLKRIAATWYGQGRAAEGFDGDDFDRGPDIEAEVAAQRVAIAAETALPGLVVVPAIGDHESREGKDLSRRFDAAVGRTLPYTGRVPARGEMRDGILSRWPWAGRVAEEVEAEFAVLRLSRSVAVKAPRLLLVGPKGCGKTSMARWICRQLGLHATVVPCGGASDAAGLAPVTRAWSTTRPGAVFMAMAQHGTCNPAMVLEEIDKTSRVGGQNGSVAGAALSMVGEDAFNDACLMAEVDISAVSWLATANDEDAVDEFLRDRFKVVRVPAPRDEDVPTLHANALADYAERKGVSPEFLPVLDLAETRALAAMFPKRGRSARAYYDMLESRMSLAVARAETRAAEEEARVAAAIEELRDAPAPHGAMH